MCFQIRIPESWRGERFHTVVSEQLVSEPEHCGEGEKSLTGHCCLWDA